MAFGANFVWAVLAHKKVITEAEAEALAKHLDIAIHPSDLKTAHKLVESILDDVEQTV